MSQRRLMASSKRSYGDGNEPDSPKASKPSRGRPRKAGKTGSLRRLKSQASLRSQMQKHLQRMASAKKLKNANKSSLDGPITPVRKASGGLLKRSSTLSVSDLTRVRSRTNSNTDGVAKSPKLKSASKQVSQPKLTVGRVRRKRVFNGSSLPVRGSGKLQPSQSVPVKLAWASKSKPSETKLPSSKKKLKASQKKTLKKPASKGSSRKASQSPVKNIDHKKPTRRKTAKKSTKTVSKARFQSAMIKGGKNMSASNLQTGKRPLKSPKSPKTKTTASKSPSPAHGRPPMSPKQPTGARRKHVRRISSKVVVGPSNTVPETITPSPEASPGRKKTPSSARKLVRRDSVSVAKARKAKKKKQKSSMLRRPSDVSLEDDNEDKPSGVNAVAPEEPSALRFESTPPVVIRRSTRMGRSRRVKVVIASEDTPPASPKHHGGGEAEQEHQTPEQSEHAASGGEDMKVEVVDESFFDVPTREKGDTLSELDRAAILAHRKKAKWNTPDKPKTKRKRRAKKVKAKVDVSKNPFLQSIAALPTTKKSAATRKKKSTPRFSATPVKDETVTAEQDSSSEASIAFAVPAAPPEAINRRKMYNKSPRFIPRASISDEEDEEDEEYSDSVTDNDSPSPAQAPVSPGPSFTFSNPEAAAKHISLLLPKSPPSASNARHVYAKSPRMQGQGGEFDDDEDDEEYSDSISALDDLDDAIANHGESPDPYATHPSEIDGHDSDTTQKPERKLKFSAPASPHPRMDLAADDAESDDESVDPYGEADAARPLSSISSEPSPPPIRKKANNPYANMPKTPTADMLQRRRSIRENREMSTDQTLMEQPKF